MLTFKTTVDILFTLLCYWRSAMGQIHTR